MGNTIIIGAPSIGLPFLGGSNFGGGSGFGGNLLPGIGGGSGFGGSIFGNGIGGGIPGLQGTMFKLGFDALTGNMQGLFQDIADLGNLLSNFAGGNASSTQPLPGQFGGCGGGAGSPSGAGSSSGAGSPSGGAGSPSGGSPLTGPSGGDQSCGGGQGSQDQRINDLLKQIMQMFGPLLQMFSQLLNLMLDNSGNNRTLTQNRSSIQI